ncbi:sigma-54-dependent transcriptional regulator [Rubripirellula reticaptiva]|uniref:Transcriptional regulatory protein ZraR n=1 Tax=Rubripirellula reticaptiva TaxID=2528013 RepID=A0A5C6EED4_9BACT|nr:sigma-54 dependent transcriptional regulator [Rubripirellula reticaptiva]TWU47020.1 Transcriptional regulatory protein ZraR [Rubripirellula reticaptiva]
MNSNFNVLIVDDEPNIRSGLAKGLSKLANQIDTAGTVNEGLDKFDAGDFQLVIADVRMPGDRDGLDLISLVKQRSPGTTTIVITAHGSMETAVDAMRRGAFDFISKPVDLNLIREQVSRAAAHHRLKNENHELKEKLAAAGEISGIIGNSQAIQELLVQIRQVASTDATVMIQGESGTGKELIARAIHDQSNRASNPFIAVNLGALPESLLESELFGHEQGSFTGASRQKPGCFEQAIGGTLFLDEITEIPAKSQVDLLRVLESQRYLRVGGEAELQSDARIVSATNRDVSQMLAEGTFREDLYYRLNIVPIHVPPLRSRRGDVPLLVEYFLEHFQKRHGRPPKAFDSDAMQLLINARWPGNVRQLRNVIERVVVTSTSDKIGIRDLPDDLPQGEVSLNHPVRTLAEITEAAEKSGIESALAANDYHRELTAKSLCISVRTLHYKMNKYDLH